MKLLEAIDGATTHNGGCQCVNMFYIFLAKNYAGLLFRCGNFGNENLVTYEK